eukprot:TRINITY_DN4726_c0_g1_i1.p2 TRINITY_DN4726_c0_g1~~TRINITY_DN4726_c0_g1_i1.p2  ORF type:complete len:280 (+),score=83.79 TRINITY_DN4726_c0_g1_i1:448-1287(+)
MIWFKTLEEAEKVLAEKLEKLEMAKEDGAVCDQTLSCQDLAKRIDLDFLQKISRCTNDTTANTVFANVVKQKLLDLPTAKGPCEAAKHELDAAKKANASEARFEAIQAGLVQVCTQCCATKAEYTELLQDLELLAFEVMAYNETLANRGRTIPGNCDAYLVGVGARPAPAPLLPAPVRRLLDAPAAPTGAIEPMAAVRLDEVGTYNAFAEVDTLLRTPVCCWGTFEIGNAKEPWLPCCSQLCLNVADAWGTLFTTANCCQAPYMKCKGQCDGDFWMYEF